MRAGSLCGRRPSFTDTFLLAASLELLPRLCFFGLRLDVPPLLHFLRCDSLIQEGQSFCTSRVPLPLHINAGGTIAPFQLALLCEVAYVRICQMPAERRTSHGLRAALPLTLCLSFGPVPPQVSKRLGCANEHLPATFPEATDDAVGIVVVIFVARAGVSMRAWWYVSGVASSGEQLLREEWWEGGRMNLDLICIRYRVQILLREPEIFATMTA